MKHDHRYEEDTFLDYRTKLGNAYFALETALNKMDGLFSKAKEHPAQVSKDEAEQAQKFLETAGKVIQDEFTLFIGMVED